MTAEWPGEVLQALCELRESVHDLHRKADLIMTQQDDINAAVAAVTGLLTDLQAQTAQIATDLAVSLVVTAVLA